MYSYVHGDRAILPDKFDAPNYRYDDVCIRMRGDKLVWDKTEVNAQSSVCLYLENRVGYNTRELMTLLSNPESELATLLETAGTITLCVSYWVLVDLRDKTLDANPDLECNNEDPEMPECHPDNDLDPDLVAQCRSLLQQFTNLHVYFDETHMGYWEDCCLSRYTGLVGTFHNISDYDYSCCDKYGCLVIETLERAHALYGARTERPVFLHGSDDWCYEGQSCDKVNYIQLAQEGLYHGSWGDLDPFVKPHIPYMQFRNLPLSQVPLLTECPNLRHLEAEVNVDTSSIIIPDCPKLQYLDLNCEGPQFSVTIEGCRNLKYIGISGDYPVMVTWLKN